MMPPKSFEEFVEDGTVKEQFPDNSRARSLEKEAEASYSFLKTVTDKLGINDENSSTIIKISYDILMALIRAKMLQKGFNSSGQGAHEAEVSYMRNIGFSENDIQFANQLRYFRNGVMYYGKRLDAYYANKVIEFLNKAYPKLKQLAAP